MKMQTISWSRGSLYLALLLFILLALPWPEISIVKNCPKHTCIWRFWNFWYMELGCGDQVISSLISLTSLLMSVATFAISLHSSPSFKRSLIVFSTVKVLGSVYKLSSIKMNFKLFLKDFSIFFFFYISFLVDCVIFRLFFRRCSSMMTIKSWNLEISGSVMLPRHKIKEASRVKDNQSSKY